MSTEEIFILSNKFEREEKFKKIKSSVLIDYLSQKLKLEQDLVKYHSSILNVKYLKLRRKEKSSELIENLKDFASSGQNLLKFKNLIENLFDQSFQDYENLTKFVIDNFIFIKDKLISNFDESLNMLKKDYEIRLEESKSNFDSDKLRIENKYKDYIKDIDDYIINLEANFYYDTLHDNALLARKKTR